MFSVRVLVCLIQIIMTSTQIKWAFLTYNCNTQGNVGERPLGGGAVNLTAYDPSAQESLNEVFSPK